MGSASSSDAVIYRFPAGASEYHLSEKVPRVGDELQRGGSKWVVVAVGVQEDGATVVTLSEAASATAARVRP